MAKAGDIRNCQRAVVVDSDGTRRQVKATYQSGNNGKRKTYTPRRTTTIPFGGISEA